jgi:DNA mismatch repair protein MutL
MADEEVGTRLSLAASKVTAQEPVSCPVGCHFRVENLFYNVPVRRKFLKSNATELNNILTAFQRIALVYPQIAFTLHSNGAELYNLRSGSLLQRITDIFGRPFGQELLPVEVQTAMGHVSGFVGKPEVARRKGAHQYFFVNGRYMRHPYFHKAVLTAYERLVAEGNQPPYLLYFDVEPADIDVNIHPTKTEIKFENEQALWQILSAAVKDAIGRFCDIPAINFDTEGRPDIPVFDPQQSTIATPRVAYNPTYNPFKSSAGGSAGGDAGGNAGDDAPFGSSGAAGSFGSSGAAAAAPSLFGSGVGGGSAATAPGFSAGLFDEAPVAAPSLLSEKSPVHFQYKGRYIMTAVKSGLMIVDQHRASVRILYEKYLAETAAQALVPQRVLFPEALHFPPAEAAMLEELLPQLTALGFELSPLGAGSYAVNAIPTGVDGDPVALVRTIVADAGQGGGATVPRDRLALSLARATAVPYGQLLSNDEMEALINQLFACDSVNYTPDGHAVLSILPQTDIDRLLNA